MYVSNYSALLKGEGGIAPRDGVITFSFTQGTHQVSAATQQSIRYVFKHLIEPFIDVRFEETVGEGNIKFRLTDKVGQDSFERNQTIYLTRNEQSRSQGNNATTNSPQSNFGSFEFETLIHNILHALGLKHAGNYGTAEDTAPFLQYKFDNTDNTVMSFNLDTISGKGAITPMPFDIAALQSLYGERSLNTGDTTYVFTSTHSFSDGTRTWGSAEHPSKLTLSDTGGNDTLDFSQLPFSGLGYHLDASTDGIFTTGGGVRGSAFRPVDVSQSLTTARSTSRFGTRLSLTTKVERIIGSSSSDIITAGDSTWLLLGEKGSDRLFGNDEDNVIFGGSGVDTISGGGGDDTLYGGNGDTDSTGEPSIDFLLGGDGDDRLWGEDGADELNGEAHNDILLGGAGDDKLFGSANRQSDNSEVDLLYGGTGADLFALGYTENNIEHVFYRGSGFAIIKDWEFGSDKIQLGRSSGKYTLLTKNLIGDNSVDVAVLHNGNLIAVVEDTGAELSRSDFIFH
ncbi:MAG: hypothetical protein AAFQ74_02235 [Cyanobacteria bacterium J06623_4]